jgi:hypothetical protein
MEKLCSAKQGYKYCNIAKICSATLKNMHCNIEKYVLQQPKYVLQHLKTCTVTSKNMYCNVSRIMYCNISSSSTTTSQKHLLQQPKNPIATFEKQMLHHPEKLIATREKQQKKKHTKQPMTHHLRAHRRKKGIGTASLRSRGGGLRSREGPDLPRWSRRRRPRLQWRSWREGRQWPDARARLGERASGASEWARGVTGWDKESVGKLGLVVPCVGSSWQDGHPHDIIIDLIYITGLVNLMEDAAVAACTNLSEEIIDEHIFPAAAESAPTWIHVRHRLHRPPPRSIPSCNYNCKRFNLIRACVHAFAEHV